MSTTLISKEEIDRIMKEIQYQADLDMSEELATWGIEPDDMMQVMDWFIKNAIRSLVSGSNAFEVMGGTFYTGLSLGVKLAMEAEMRRMTDSGT